MCLYSYTDILKTLSTRVCVILYYIYKYSTLDLLLEEKVYDLLTHICLFSFRPTSSS
jgi:hypothetical protein